MSVSGTWAHRKGWSCSVGLRGRAGCVLLGVCLAAMLLAGCGGEDTTPAMLTVITDPEGALVNVRGVDRGVSPLTLTDLAPGPATVVAAKEDYDTDSEQVKLAQGAHETVNITLIHKVGFVTIRSKPSGARVVLDTAVDGEPQDLGVTPLYRVAFPVGERSYTISLENYESSAAAIAVQENYEYDKYHELTPLNATLTLLTRPTSATVWIDEHRQVETSPARFTLKPGTYVIAVQRDGYLRTEERVTLEPNGESRIEIQMPPGKEPPGMIFIPEGPFLMGQDGSAPDEAPQRKINLPAYYIDRTEVTNAEFKEVFPGHTYPEGEGNFPVVGVSFTEALDYAGKVGKRLPTEAEWEKAARGEDGRAYPWGDMFDKQLCNINESGFSRPLAVGSFPLGSSPYRVQDMAGNVHEWVDSWYEAYPGNQQVTKDYGQIYRVLRGGSYTTPRYDARCARRHFDRIDAARKDYGFRCVMDLPQSLQTGESP